MRVGAVVLHHGRWPAVRAALDALLAQTRPPEATVFVDNASGDRSAAAVSDAYPGVEVFEASVNRGYAAGMNLGIDHVLAGESVDAVLLLTHDCLLAPDALALLVGHLDASPQVGAVGPLLGWLSAPERVFSAGMVMNTRAWDPHHVREPVAMEAWAGAAPRAVAALDGACVLLRAEARRAAGRLDEAYFLYYEECDYLLRLRQAGFGVELVPAARAWQEPGEIPPYLAVRNRLRFVARTAPRRYLVRELVRVPYRLARGRVPGQSEPVPGARRAGARGLAAFVRRQWGAPPS
jgi:GT2 family glycosyltransferase